MGRRADPAWRCPGLIPGAGTQSPSPSGPGNTHANQLKGRSERSFPQLVPCHPAPLAPSRARRQSSTARTEMLQAKHQGAAFVFSSHTGLLKARRARGVRPCHAWTHTRVLSNTELCTAPPAVSMFPPPPGSRIPWARPGARAIGSLWPFALAQHGSQTPRGSRAP